MARKKELISHDVLAKDELHSASVRNMEGDSTSYQSRQYLKRLRRPQCLWLRLHQIEIRFARYQGH